MMGNGAIKKCILNTEQPARKVPLHDPVQNVEAAVLNELHCNTFECSSFVCINVNMDGFVVSASLFLWVCFCLYPAPSSLQQCKQRPVLYP